MDTQRVLGERYELLRRIGMGGMAEVFLAHDSLLQRDVAVKVLDMAGVSDHTFVERFRREARAAAAINHPNVVAIYDWGESTASSDVAAVVYYLVMEYVPGPNLKEKIQRGGALLEDEALRLASQIAAALEAAHARGLIHRDIKSQNVLIDSSGTAKVADFGIAYLEGLTHLTQTNAVSGTAHYISPEQAQGKRVDARTDIYSLGVVLYEMLTGHVPFEGESLIDVALHHVQDQPVPVSRLQSGVSPAAESVVTIALAKDPARRFSRAAEMRAALDRARTEIARQTARTEYRPVAPVAVEAVPRPLPHTRPLSAPGDVSHTVKLGTGVPGRRERVRQPQPHSRWWLWALPILLLALGGGALAMHVLSAGGPTSALPPTDRSHATRSPLRPGAPRSVATHPAAASTRSPGLAPTNVPSTVAPTSLAAPAVVPTVASSKPTSAPVPSGAATPDSAVTSFYDLVTQHRYAAASALWSRRMQAQYPPSTNIYGRFDSTQSMSVRITSTTQQGGTATVGVALIEQLTDGTVKGYVGSWDLIQTQFGWLLDSVNLSPAQISTGPVSHGKSKRTGNVGTRGNG